VVVCGVTVLARLFGPGHHRQVDQRPGNTASSARNVRRKGLPMSKVKYIWIGANGSPLDYVLLLTYTRSGGAWTTPAQYLGF
jgi:hypothetical protein